MKPLGNVDSVLFSLTSSDVGQFGMNTPGFFAIDEFTTRDASVGLLDINETLQASVYPNPALNVLTIDLPRKYPSAIVTIFNVMGKQIFKQNVQGITQVDFSNIDAGVYFVHIESQSEVKTVRVVKN